ncbi:MAG: cytochrome c3 family protein [Sterolibacterium sp.]|nr:cytochrome c3 family protein [Sterolibacterium sp.]
MRKYLAIVAILLLSLLSTPLYGGTVMGSKHDLSTSTSPQVCKFCHTPHNANDNTAIAGAPLWNRAETTQTFTLYGSASMSVAVEQPRVATRLCLSCHDGVNASTVVHGASVSTKHSLVNSSVPANCNSCHARGFTKQTLKIGTNLNNDHPVSMPYPTPALDPAFNTPTDTQKGWGGASPNEIKLYGGYVECGSCHNVHNPDIAPFLRKTNVASALCLTCHKK